MRQEAETNMKRQKRRRIRGTGLIVALIFLLGGCSGNAAASSRQISSGSAGIDSKEAGNLENGIETGEEDARDKAENGETVADKITADDSAAGENAVDKSASQKSEGKYCRVYEMYDYDEEEWYGPSTSLILDYNIPENYVQFTCEFWAQNAYFSTKAQPENGDYFIQTFTFATEENIPELDKIYLEYTEDEIKIYSYVMEYSEIAHDYVEVRWPNPAKFKCTWDSRYDN